MRAILGNGRRLLTLLVLVGVTRHAHAGPQDFDFTVLDNGLQVVLIPRKAAPVVASVIVVKTGLRNEEVGINGVSHFLEHLLFNGTERRTQKQLYDEMDLIGGYNNANTGPDYTTFMVLVPKENVGKALDIQADMLFHSTIPNDKLEKERGIVLREIDRDRDNPDSEGLRIFRAVLFEDSPYAWPILGPKEVVASVPRESVVRYYQTYYVPNNMIALLIGDFDRQQMLSHFRKYFGSAKPGSLPVREIRTPEPPASDRLLLHFAPGPQVSIHLGTVLAASDVRSLGALEVAAALLSQSEGDWSLAKRLCSEFGDGVVDATVDFEFHPDCSALTASVKCDSGAPIAEVASLARHHLRGFYEKPLSKGELKSVLLQKRTEDVLNSERPHFFGMLKAPYLSVFGPSILAEYWSELEGLTVDELAHICERWLGAAHFVVVAVGPVGTSAAESSPAAAPPSVRRLPNGATVILQRDTSADIFAAHLLVRGRCFAEPEGADGVADLLHRLLPRGTRSHSGDLLQQALDDIGARVQVTDMPWIPFDDYYTQPDFSFVRVECLDEYSGQALALLSEMVREPEISESALVSEKQKMLARVRSGVRMTSERSRQLFMAGLFKGHPFARPLFGTEKSLSSVTTQEVRGFARAYLQPGNLVLAVITTRDVDQIWPEIKKAFGWAGQEGVDSVSYAGWPEPLSGLQKVEQRQGSGRAYLRLGNLLGEVDDVDVPALLVAAEVLSSRIAFDLREERGWAYSIGFGVQLVGTHGWYSATMNLAPENLQAATDAIREHIRRLQTEACSAKEVERGRNQVRSRYAMRLLRRINRAFYMTLDYARTGLVDWTTATVEAVSGVQPSDVQRVAKRYFSADDGVVVWVD